MYILFKLWDNYDNAHGREPVSYTHLDVYKRQVVDGAPAEDYIRAVLTDDEELVDAVGRMRSVYPNLLRLDFENRRTKGGGILKQPSAESRKPPEELFAEFYEWQQNLPLDGEKRELIRRLLEEECR